MNRLSVAERPFVGLIVEGEGEYYNLPSIVCRLLGSTLNIKRSHAHGNGGIIKNLEDHLRMLIKTYHPYWVMVVLDKRDALESGRYKDCADLVEQLTHAVDEWRGKVVGDPGFTDMPISISIVVEVPAFESWIIADCDGLSVCEFIDAEICHHQCSNVDDEVVNPGIWLKERLARQAKGYGRFTYVDMKGRDTVRAFIDSIDISIARQRSKSFDKFCREIEQAYESWCGELCL